MVCHLLVKKKLPTKYVLKDFTTMRSFVLLRIAMHSKFTFSLTLFTLKFFEQEGVKQGGALYDKGKFSS